jgi:hypothetical protein
MMVYQERFSDNDLGKIIEEGMIYMCACPAQVAENVRKVRNLYRYQINCLENPNNDSFVDTTIAKTAIIAHSQLEECMAKILEHEKWDQTTLEMPANLRIRQAEEINSDSRFLESLGD